MQAEVLLLAIGFVAGISSGLFGIGGGVIMVPAFVTLLNFTQFEANGTSLAARLVPVGIFAAMTYHRSDKLHLKTAFIIAIGIAIGAFFGSKLALSLPEATLQRLFGIFLLYVVWRFTDPIQYVRRNAQPKKETVPRKPIAAWYLMFILGLVAGVTGGLFGLGGGVVIGPALATLFHYEQMLAVGTSLGALQFPAGIPAVANYYADGNVVIRSSVLVGIGIVFGAYFGARVAFRLPRNIVRRLYVAFLLVMALRFILQF